LVVRFNRSRTMVVRLASTGQVLATIERHVCTMSTMHSACVLHMLCRLGVYMHHASGFRLQGRSLSSAGDKCGWIYHSHVITATMVQ
jgi:hypothetical protein